MSGADPDLGGVLAALDGLLAACEIPYSLIGGIAASALGQPRFTHDVDALIMYAQETVVEVLGTAPAHGFIARRANPEFFAREFKLVLLRHETTGVNVDLLLGLFDFERELIAKAKRAAVLGGRFPLPRPDDLLIMKLVAARPQDIADSRALLATGTIVDNARVLDFVTQFAAVLESPELVEGAKKMLDEAKKKLPPGKPRTRGKKK